MYQKQDSSIVKHLDFLVLDLIMLEVSYIFSYMIRYGSGEFYKDYGYTAMSVILLMIQFLVAVFGESYKNILQRGYLKELKKVIVQNTLVMILACTFMFLGKVQTLYSRLVFIQLWVISIVCMYIARIIWKNIVRKRVRTSDERAHLLVLSEGDKLENCIRMLQEKNISPSKLQEQLHMTKI